MFFEPPTIEPERLPQRSEHPQCLADVDRLEFGRVRPAFPSLRSFCVINVGAGETPLEVELRSDAPWLKLSCDGDWSNEVKLPPLVPDARCIVAVRVDAGSANGSTGRVETPVRVITAGNEEASIYVQAELLELCPLLLLPVPTQDDLPHFHFEPGLVAPEAVTLTCSDAPLGSKPVALLRVRRADGQLARVDLHNVRVLRGKAQWVRLQVLPGEADPLLRVEFFTANRKPGETVEVELEIPSGDDLVSPARLKLQVHVLAPALLSTSHTQGAVSRLGTADLDLLLENVGASRLEISSVRVPLEYQSWLSLPAVDDLALEPGSTYSLSLKVSGKSLHPGMVHGAVRVTSTHRGRNRQVIKYLPVHVEVRRVPLLIRRRTAEWTLALAHGKRRMLRLEVANQSEHTLTGAFRIEAAESGEAYWLQVSPNSFELLPGNTCIARVEVCAPLSSDGEVFLDGAVALHMEGERIRSWDVHVVLGTPGKALRHRSTGEGGEANDQ